MKRLAQNKNFKLGITIFSIVAACILFFFFIFKIDEVLIALKWIMKLLSPFIVGFAFAYLLSPIVQFFQDNLFLKMFKDKKDQKKIKSARFLSILFTFLLVLAVIIILFSRIIPELLTSLEILIRNAPMYLEQIRDYFLHLLKNHEELEIIVLNNLDAINNYLLTTINNNFLPKIEEWVVIFSNGIFEIFKALYNIVVGLIISIYFLYDSEEFKGQIKKTLYAFLPIKNANGVIDFARRADKIFGGFLMSMVLISSVLGVATFVFLSIFNFPYKVLIAVLVGVTNVIPYFGPFIGGIPSALIILLQAPSKFWLIVVYLIGIQQVEGYYLAPKVSGIKTGIKSFWVLFAILTFGSAFGLPGMILGVPVFALIYSYAKAKLNKTLEDKNLPTDNLVYAKIDRINLEDKNVFKKKSN